MKLILIRHGETHANVLYNTEDRILIGALESEITKLNEMGINQAKQTKEKLETICVDEIYCSDLTRTKQTANIIFDDREIHYTPLLRERSLGSDQGKKAKELFLDPQAWNYHVDTEKDSLEDCLSKKVIDGECYNDVLKRCKQFLNQLDFNEDKTIAIVSHFHVLRCMTYLLLNKEIDKEMFDLMIPNASPIIYEYNQGEFRRAE